MGDRMNKKIYDYINNALSPEQVRMTNYSYATVDMRGCGWFHLKLFHDLLICMRRGFLCCKTIVSPLISLQQEGGYVFVSNR